MRVSGSKINSTDVVQKHGLIKQNIMEIIRMDAKRVQVNFNGAMVPPITVNLIIIILKVEVNMFGLMLENLLATGIIIKCMVKVYLRGLMENNI